MMTSQLLELQNYWWKEPHKLKDDYHLTRVEGKSYFYKNPLIDSFQPKAGDFHILRGPRQVGKTTLLKAFIKKIIQSGTYSPEKVFFYSCETMTDFNELRTLLQQWLVKVQDVESCLFLDEISFVTKWQQAILSLMNMGLLKNTCLVVTGSNARDLKESSERFPGRRGKGKDYTVYPLSPFELKELPTFSEQSLSDILLTYLRIGGFPHAIQSYIENGYVTQETYDTYKNWIIGDAARFDLAEETLKNIFYKIAISTGSRLTWNTLIQNTPIKSHETGLKYVEHLSDAFICKIHYSWDEKKKGPAFHKARKLYLVDPLLYDIGLCWGSPGVSIWDTVLRRSLKTETQGSLLELAYVNAINRRYLTSYYWYSSKNQKEVDLVIPGKKLKTYDCKWSPMTPFKAMNQTIDILHRDNFDEIESMCPKLSSSF